VIGMALIPEEDVKKAKEIDLLTYLRCYEPFELKHVGGSTYCTREHDSLKISNGKWYWFSQGVGGRSALDYLMKVRGYSFRMAVEAVLGRIPRREPPAVQEERPAEKKKKAGPNIGELSETPENARNYLIRRGIDHEIIDWCIERKLIMETKEYANAVFAGYDQNGKLRYAALRGTNGNFKRDAGGSDKRFSFSISEQKDAETVHIFEAAIDLLSFATLQKMAGKDWLAEPMVSLSGVFVSRDGSSPLPKALDHFLKEHASIRSIHLHLDNDEVGRGACIGLCSKLHRMYDMYVNLPEEGKDVNDELMARIKRSRDEHER